ARELKKRGLRVEELQSLWLRDPAPSWEELLASKEKSSGKSIHVYTRSDACGAAETWALFLGKKQEYLKGLGVFGDPGLALAVKRDTLGIGYNNVNYAYDPSTHKPHSGLTILPLDRDGNGRIDEQENFYSTRDALVQAISEGRYPSPPARDLYLVCKGKPGRPEVREFLEWILTRGQDRLEEGGYISPGDQTVRDALKKLSES
ncbi:MAG: substrate-binding domain-containing protein, partial [Acidobacteria bacterium]|nr:substrate-binding domain-containing protein [Acidobacteriota bacterium]